ncbi:isopropylmalate isomerase [Streptomyces cellostaticus]|uniref:3-isopropylmalate dehydratase small subunit n=1 Tax=Streptomyces cellostaticus TaxID=67285 RepID=A0A117PWW1_9ACTN|nr:3-isopropylmalate dehydratase small subunit [Streptomyces cellostaticus]KUM95678.1 isopropylmalate isomerase [Streptomyces cellostaticus]GHI09723.1 3-isopropylmalate dehydratase small subunit [Streptomyces cellostaticus]
MEPLTEHTGRAIVLRRDHVDTDQIVPAAFCKRLTKSGYDDALFAHWREDPDFVLNRPAARTASVLVGGANFGTGSSREHAVWALRDWGFAVVVASSFGDIFLRNALKNGLLAVALPAETLGALADAVEADPDLAVTVDLHRLELRAAGGCHPFTVDKHARFLLLNGLDDIAVTLRGQDAVLRYERDRRPWLPSMAPGSLTGEPMSSRGRR